MRTILFLLVSITILECNAQNNSVSDEENYNNREFKSLYKDANKFKKLTFNKAVKRYGEPYESTKIELTTEALTLHLSDELIKKHFPENGKYIKEPYLLEASWKRLDESWITVWYKFEDDVWKPVNMLITI